VDVGAVASAVDELAAIIRADGGDLVLVTADAAMDRIEVRLDLEGVSCLDCILPPDQLRQVLQDGIARRVPSEFELVVHDPR
jgi:Fe-S cluster biogenesis protein NfuA